MALISIPVSGTVVREVQIVDELSANALLAREVAAIATAGLIIVDAYLSGGGAGALFNFSLVCVPAGTPSATPAIDPSAGLTTGVAVFAGSAVELARRIGVRVTQLQAAGFLQIAKVEHAGAGAGALFCAIILAAQIAPSPAAGGGAPARIIWRPDGTGTAATWADVMAQLTEPGMQIWVDQQGGVYEIPFASAPYEVQKAFFEAPIDAGITIDILDGGMVQNLAGLVGTVILRGNGTVNPALILLTVAPGAPIPFFLRGFACQLLNQGTVPMVALPSGSIGLVLSDGPNFMAAGAGAPVFEQTGLALLVISTNAAQTMVIGNNSVGGDITAVMQLVQDGTYLQGAPTIPAFLGQFFNSAEGTSGGGGPTALRPVPFLFGAIPQGCRYWDTDQSTEVVWNGTDWQSTNEEVAAENANLVTLGAFTQVALTTAMPVQSGDEVLVQASLEVDGTLAGEVVMEIVATPSVGPPVSVGSVTATLPATTKLVMAFAPRRVILAADSWTFKLQASVNGGGSGDVPASTGHVYARCSPNN
jgi:hypothetical protein